MGLPPGEWSEEKAELREVNPCMQALVFIFPSLSETRNIRPRLSPVAASPTPYDLAFKVIVVDDASGEANRFRVQFDLGVRTRDQARVNGCS